MDLLCHAYGASSDEEEDKKLVGPVPPPKRFKPADSYQRFQPAGSIDQKLEPPIPGRYVSKRERMLSSSRVTCSNSPSNAITSPVMVEGKAIWTDVKKKLFIDLCIQQARQGGMPGTSLSKIAWKHVLDEFDKATGCKWTQKQFKNQWDNLKKQYNAWIKLTSQTSIGYNNITGAVTMDADRWEEYIKANPAAKNFREKPLDNVADLEYLFGGSTAVGEAKCTLSMGVLPSECIIGGEREEDVGDEVPVTPISLVDTPTIGQEDATDSGFDDIMSDLRRKRPCPPRRRKELRNKDLFDLAEKLFESINNTSQLIVESQHTGPSNVNSPNLGQEDSSLRECIEILHSIDEIPDTSPLYGVAIKSFKESEYRVLWKLMRSNKGRISFLKSLMK